MPIIFSLLLTAVVSYLWGSIPAGYWMGKLLRGKDFDIRDHGSRKIGATNVQRTLGNIPALIVFIIDLSKGIGPALLATYVPLFQADGWGIFVAGLLALLGHCFPVFIGFRGGRGVLTGAGSMLVVSPITFLISATTTSSTIVIWRYVSLGSIVGCLTTMICGIIFYTVGLLNPQALPIFKVSLPQMLFLLVVPALVIFFHRDNISRLLSGTERKLGQSKPTSQESPSNA